MIIDIGVGVAILSFLIIVDSIAIIVAILCVVNTVVVVIFRIRVEVISDAVIVVIVV